MKPARTIFWTAFGLLAWTQVGYGLFLSLLRKSRCATSSSADYLSGGDDLNSPQPRGETAKGHAGGDATARADGDHPRISLIIAAYREEEVIADKVRNALALDWPRDRLEIIVAVDGGADPNADATAERARDAGADMVLKLPRGGKIRSQDAAVHVASGRLLAFSDANSMWEPDALQHLVPAFDDPEVGYVCGQVTFVNNAGTNQEGLYWRYEMWMRENESALSSITAGNGAIYATRPESYFEVDPVMGHDLSFPFNMVKRGWRAIYVPEARAVEKMVPSIEGEWARKRRMMSHAWPIITRGGLLSGRGYSPLYALMIASHRGLRYASPFLHLVGGLSTLSLMRRGSPYNLAAVAQTTMLAAALGAKHLQWRPLLLARYYVLTTAAIAAGFVDWLRHGTSAGWEAAEGTR